MTNAASYAKTECWLHRLIRAERESRVMKATVSLGRWVGIPVGLHYSWFIIAWLITLSLGVQFSAQNRDWSTAVVWTTATLTAVLFFGGLVVHELAHALVARWSGLPVRGITLFALGGVSQIGRDAATPAREFWMAIAGPIASFLIGGACYALAAAQGWTPSARAPSPVAALLGWLGYINVWLALFNLIPGFPLDGGRILRSILWGVTGKMDRSTKIAARIGQAVGLIFIWLGLLSLVSRGNAGGLWLAFIGWFLLEAARANYMQVELAGSLRNVRVGEIMSHDCDTVDAGTRIRTFIDEQLLHTGRRCFFVRQDDRVIGLVTPQDLRRVPRVDWPHVAVTSAMRRLEALHSVSAHTPAAEALALMTEHDVNQLPVVTAGQLQGVVDRSHVLQLLHTKAELAA